MSLGKLFRPVICGSFGGTCVYTAATAGVLFRRLTGHSLEITLFYCQFELHVHLCVNPSVKEIFPFSKEILGDLLWAKRPG